MRASFLSLAMALLALSYIPHAQAQTSAFTTNLSLGSKGSQVLALQKFLNRDSNTRIAAAGPGSPGNETSYFGVLTKAAVVRFQNKYAKEVLVPAGLGSGNGFVGAYTRAKLNALSVLATGLDVKNRVPSAATSTATSTATRVATSTDYLVTATEKTDIYAGDKKFTNYQDQITDAINATVVSRGSVPMQTPTTTATTFPSVVIGIPSPRSGAPGAKISLGGIGFTTNSIVYFGSDYVVRAVSKNAQGGISFSVPPLPPGAYDIAVRTGNTVSNTTPFVILGPESQPVRLDSVTPATVKYGETLIITGFGFTAQNNTVVTTHQKITSVPSSDGKTLSVTVAPESLRKYAKVSNGSVNLPMTVYVMNANGFSDSEKSFTLTI